jgi:hypothetical protein
MNCCALPPSVLEPLEAQYARLSMTDLICTLAGDVGRRAGSVYDSAEGAAPCRHPHAAEDHPAADKTAPGPTWQSPRRVELDIPLRGGWTLVGALYARLEGLLPCCAKADFRHPQRGGLTLVTAKMFAERGSSLRGDAPGSAEHFCAHNAALLVAFDPRVLVVG